MQTQDRVLGGIQKRNGLLEKVVEWVSEMTLGGGQPVLPGVMLSVAGEYRLGMGWRRGRLQGASSCKVSCTFT